MKTFILFFLYSLITEGVFGESVKEGDSVTLHTGLSEIQTNDVIDWWFGGHRIARMKKGREPSITDYVLAGKFKGRLKLDGQTGDLTITNFRNTDSGDYKVSNSTDTLNVLFTLIDVSVLEGDSVTLQTGLTEIQTDNVIHWRYGQQKSLVAEINRTSGIFKTYDGPDERFKHRLQLDHQTGSLNITNITNTDSGLYEVRIISKQSRHHKKLFSVTVRDAVKSVSVKKGETVTLQTNVTEIQNDDLILWMFGNIRLAEIDKADQRFYISDVLEKSFRDRLELDHQTGSLTITDTRTTDSGLYKVKIISSRYIVNSIFTVTVETYINTAYTPRGTASSSNNYPAVPGPRLSPAAVAGIGVGLLLAAAAAAGVIYYRYKKCKKVTHIQMNASPIIQPPDNVDLDSNVIYVQDHPPSRNNGEVDKIYDEMTDDTENVSMKNLCGSQSAGSDTENSPFREIKGNKEHGYDIL